MTGVVTLVTNGGATGITRAYGGKGAFVSEWVIDRSNLAAISGHDPTHPNDYYFVTTGGAAGANVNNATRLWRVRFTDLANPAAGKTEGNPLE